MKILNQSILAVATVAGLSVANIATADSVHNALEQAGIRASGNSVLVNTRENVAWTIQEYVEKARAEKEFSNSASVAGSRAGNGVYQAL